MQCTQTKSKDRPIHTVMYLQLAFTCKQTMCAIHRRWDRYVDRQVTWWGSTWWCYFHTWTTVQYMRQEWRIINRLIALNILISHIIVIILRFSSIVLMWLDNPNLPWILLQLTYVSRWNLQDDQSTAEKHFLDGGKWQNVTFTGDQILLVSNAKTCHSGDNVEKTTTTKNNNKAFCCALLTAVKLQLSLISTGRPIKIWQCSVRI